MPGVVMGFGYVSARLLRMGVVKSAPAPRCSMEDSNMPRGTDVKEDRYVILILIPYVIPSFSIYNLAYIRFNYPIFNSQNFLCVFPGSIFHSYK